MRTWAAILCLLVTLLARPAVAQQSCPSLVVSNNNDVVNGNTSSPCALIASNGGDGISLREALLAANNATGSGTITISFASALAGETIALTERFAPITRSQITLTGPTNNGQPDITLDATNAANAGSIFFIATSNFAMSGMNIINLPTNIISVMQIGGSGYNLTGQAVTSPSQICCFQITGNAFSNSSGANSFGIYVAANVSNETISDVSIINNSFTQLFEGIDVQGGGGNSNSGSVIEDVSIFGNSFSQMTANATSAVELGDTNGTNNVIQRVSIVQNTFTGNLQGAVLDINGTTSQSTIQDTVIARNVFTGNLQAMGLEAGVDTGTTHNTIANTQIVDNLVDLTGFDGQGSGTIQIQDNQSGTNNTVTGVTFVNDTIYNGGSASPPGWGVWVTSSGGVTGVSVSNSILWGAGSSVPLNGLTSSQVSYSVINQSGFSGTNNNINSDPLFVDVATANFGLQSGSPARGAGTSAGAPAIDIDCQPRGSPPAIGAYELDGPDICPSSAGLPTTTHDFNGDGYSDMLWRDTSGNMAIWEMQGSTIVNANSAGLGGVATTWSIVGQHDFNGDGKADMLWHDTSGNLAIWEMSGTTILNSNSAGLGAVSTVWAVAGVGDFNGDGMADILWRNTTTGDVAIWFMNGTTILNSNAAGVGNVATNWSVVGVGDFNGDGKADILWKNTSNGNLAIYLMSGTTITSSATFANLGAYSVAGTGDFNGDGMSDILLRDSSGDIAIWEMNGTTILNPSTAGVGNLSTVWSVSETGDFDGNGTSDILWRDTSGDIAIWYMNGTTLTSGVGFGAIPTTFIIQGTNAD